VISESDGLAEQQDGAAPGPGGPGARGSAPALAPIGMHAGIRRGGDRVTDTPECVALALHALTWENTPDRRKEDPWGAG
jgi:hypothetical protein